MNYSLSVIYRAIPLISAIFCFSFAYYILLGTGTDAALSGHVVLFLGFICICLFCTACTIIRQLIDRFSRFDIIFYSIFAIASALITVYFGIVIVSQAVSPWQYVSGYVIIGLALICGCISTVVLGSREFSRIPHIPAANEALPYQRCSIRLFYIAPVIFAIIAWALAFHLMPQNAAESFIAGHVMLGLAAICTCLIALVDSIVRQECNFYNETERWFYPIVVLIMAIICFAYGGYLLAAHKASYYIAPGYVLIGLGTICLSIFGKVVLLALVWRRKFPYAAWIPLIPVTMAVICFIIGGFLLYHSTHNPDYLIPGNVIIGLGAISTSLFSIVSILESGTSEKSET